MKQARHMQSHARILDAAARAVCRAGFAGVGVANVMNEAGLTHGGFYAHFDSREALLSEAVEHAGAASIARLQERMQGRIAQGASPLRALVESYLSETHLESLDQSCPVAALASEMSRTGPELREISVRRIRDLIGQVEKVMPAGQPPGSAAAIACTMVGALQIARICDGAEREAVLRNCRNSILDRDATDGLAIKSNCKGTP